MILTPHQRLATAEGERDRARDLAAALEVQAAKVRDRLAEVEHHDPDDRQQACETTEAVRWCLDALRGDL